MGNASDSKGSNEGEGNRSADRRSREKASRNVESGRSQRAAQDARRAIESDEADDLRRGEREAPGAEDEPAVDADDYDFDLDDDDEQVIRGRD